MAGNRLINQIYTYLYIPPDACEVRLCSGTAAEMIHFNSVHAQSAFQVSVCRYRHQVFNTCVAFLLHHCSSYLESSTADTQGSCFCGMAEHIAAIQHKADQAGQEVQH